jgi:deoxyribose-phosphate aldolase
MKDFKSLFGKYDFSLTENSVKEQINEILKKDFDKNNNKEVYKKCFSLIDLTSLNSTDTEPQIEAMMQKVNVFSSQNPDIENVAAVCIYPELVQTAKKTLRVNAKIAAVSACFPSAQTFIEAKVAEVALTVLAGADEIDVVMPLGKYLSGKYDEVFDELEEIKSACRTSHLKVILESGSLPSIKDIKQASIIAIAAGADFIKTSTGKTEPAATLEAAFTMCKTIKEYYTLSGQKIGFKPAGGISITEEAVKYYTIVKAVLGEEWLTPQLFRFGASRLANNLLSSIYDKEIKYF